MTNDTSCLRQAPQGPSATPLSNRDRWTIFIQELREYILEHHHGPNKHSRMLNAIKYTRKKIKEGKLEEAKVKEFEEVMSLRWMDEHTGGRRKKAELSSI